jgi:alkanesulfonate monooxygenase SsuD/methylene tetrahydromethanopterin reductase-like flavin-dependent oxidoreductase (luciferase family)
MMREYVALLRECLSGESVTFQGDFWQLRRFRLAIRLEEQSPKIVIAALNPQMLKLGGEIADAVLLNYIPGAHVREAVQHIRGGGNATIMSYVHAAVGDLSEVARSARKDLFNYAMADGYANMFRSAGFGSEVDQLRSHQADRDREGALASVTDRMIQAINFVGSQDEVADFVRNYIKAGVEYPILMPMPWGADRRSVTQLTLEAAAVAVS